MPATSPFSIVIGNSDHLCDSSWNNDLEYDDFHRVYICLNGKARVSAGSGWTELRGSRVYFIPGYRPFRYRCDHQLRLQWFHFRASDPLVEADLASISDIVSWPRNKWVGWDGLCRRIDEWFNAPSAELNYRFQSLLMTMLAELQTAPRDSGLDRLTQADLQRLSPAVRYMDQHFIDNPPLALVADQAHLSLVHFHRLFRKHYRISPHRYMLRLRMQMAYGLLLRGECSAKEAGARAGYPGYPYFSRVFRAYYRRCPSDVLTGRVLPAP